MDFLEELQWRGLVHQCTDLDALRQSLANGGVSLYCGFDPTAASLHVGSLVPLMTLRRFLLQGHRPVALVGGATGLIGDPSGKSAERVLQSGEDVRRRSEAIRQQVAQFTNRRISDNVEWTGELPLLAFLRDVGKHFSVNAMIQRDSVSSRLQREGEGISFTEFSYMLLQANDFLQLFQRGVTLQIGGSDQWGNMCSGVDLIRRVHGKQALAFTLPLLTTADGKKFGKTEQGTVWLDANMTSAWEFFQFWLNTQDADVVRMLKLLTLLPRETIESLEEATQSRPHERAAQRRLAFEVTKEVHGTDVAQQMELAAQTLFHKGQNVQGLTEQTLVTLSRSLPTVCLPGMTDVTLTQLLVATALESSKTKAMQVIRQGGVAVNDMAITDERWIPEPTDWLHGKFLLIKKGKKTFALVQR